MRINKNDKVKTELGFGIVVGFNKNSYYNVKIRMFDGKIRNFNSEYVKCISIKESEN